MPEPVSDPIDDPRIYEPIEDEGPHQHLVWLTDFVEKEMWEEKWTAERVLGWMLGIDLPPIEEETSYLLIWEGIEASKQIESLKPKIAKALLGCEHAINDSIIPKRSKFLKDYERYPGEAAANLWSLLRLLEQPVILGPWIRRTVKALPKARWLTAKAAEPIRQRLLSAAIYNQDTPEFVPDWKKLILGNPDQTAFRAGYPGDGIEGLRRAPDPKAGLGHFAEEIGRFAATGCTRDEHEIAKQWLARCGAVEGVRGVKEDVTGRVCDTVNQLQLRNPYGASAVPDLLLHALDRARVDPDFVREQKKILAHRQLATNGS